MTRQRSASLLRHLTAALAVSCLLLAAGCNPPNAYLRSRAMAAMSQGDTARAERRLEQALAQNGADWHAAYLLGNVRLEQDRPLEAQVLLERALSIRHDRDERPGIIDALAEALYRQGRVDQLHTLLEAEARGSGSYRAYLRQATYLAKTGHVDEARLAFEKAQYFSPTDEAGAYLATADFYEAIGDSDRAITALRQALRIEPTNATVQDRLRGYGLVPGPTVELPTTAERVANERVELTPRVDGAGD